MHSIAQYQYPIIAWREGEKKLWNPIHRKALKNRPEERVRLRIIEYLLEAGWSKHRISTEEAIKNYRDEKLRTDLICYSQDFDPKILIECKAEHISLSSKTAEQVARYNQNVGAPYLLMSNGLQDFWYKIEHENQTVVQLGSLPPFLSEFENKERNFDYWKKRGFAGTDALADLRKWIIPLLQYYAKADSTIKYLQFNQSPSDLNLDNYYHLINLNQKEIKIAVSFLATRFGGSRIIGILNSKGENKAVAEVNLDLIFNQEAPNTSVYSSDGISNLDIRKECPDFSECNTLEKLLPMLETLFNNQSP